MITNETMSLIENDLGEVFQRITDSVYIGLTEDMSPNDKEFQEEHENRLQEVLDEINKQFGI